MTQNKSQFKEQGGIATMDPSAFRRWVISKLMSMLASEKRMQSKRKKAEKLRLKNAQPHVVEYFHQVDDGYSHLTSQVLKSLLKRYDIELYCHLVTGPTGHNVAEPELLLNLGITDAKLIAPHYGLTFPECDTLPSLEKRNLAQSILAQQDSAAFLDCLADVSHAFWQQGDNSLGDLANHLGCASAQVTEDKLTQGNARRAALKHYSGAMFYYGGEWYWGIDRLYHLEQRLKELGADSKSDTALLMPQPSTELPKVKDSGTLTLEIYASLRSPYTAIVFDRAVQLAKDTGVKCVVRPVLPMVMRGVPATKEKGFYILFDTAREARAAGVPYGKVRDPIGQPARNGYALYQWACESNKGIEFFSNFLSAAFAQGVNTNSEKGLRHVIEKTGLDWREAKQQLNNANWEQTLEVNRLAMYQSGLWGVPSFRVLNAQGQETLAVWGQDRLWLVAHEIKRLIEQ